MRRGDEEVGMGRKNEASFGVAVYYTEGTGRWAITSKAKKALLAIGLQKTIT